MLEGISLERYKPFHYKKNFNCVKNEVLPGKTKDVCELFTTGPRKKLPMLERISLERSQTFHYKKLS